LKYLSPEQKALIASTLLSGSTIMKVGKSTAQFIQTSQAPVLNSLTPEQKAILMATLICGSTVREVSLNKTAQFIQTSHDLDWLKWKEKKLGPSLVSSLKEDNSGGGYRLMSVSSKLIQPLREFYSSSTNQIGRRQIPYELIVNIVEEDLFLLTWFVEGNWTFDGLDVHVPTRNSYSKADRKRLCKLLRDLGFEKAKIKGNLIIMEGQGSHVKKRIEAYTLESDDISFLPDILELKVKVPKKDITPQKAALLNQFFGMSFDQMETIYGVPKVTCWRRAKKCDTDYSSHNVLSLEASESLLEDIDYEGWNDLDNEQQILDRERAIDILLRTPFPEPFQVVDKQFRLEFQKLSTKEMALNEEKEIRPNSYYGLELCRPYFLNRYKALNSEASMSCREGWYDRDQLKQAVTFQLKYGSPVTPKRVRRALQANLRTPTLFKPAQAKFICDTYGQPGGWYWDPCCGYGGRLLGAMSSQMNYIGTDVDLETVEGNRKIYKDLKRLGQVGDLEARIVHQEAELFDISRPLDLVFTSPPYFDREQYSSADGQSYLNYGSTAQDWTDGFLKPIFKTALTHLKEGGYLVINIADLNDSNKTKETVPLVSLTTSCAVSLGFVHEDTLRMPLSNLSYRGYEPVLVFRK